MALFELPRASITFDVAPANSLTVRCSYVNARVPITEEVPSLIVRIDQTYLGTVESYGNSISIGDTVHVWLDRWAAGSTQNNVFNGIISRLSKDVEGHTPRWYEVEAVGFADHLNRVYFGYTSSLTTVSSIITAIVQPAVTAGYITIGSIHSTDVGTINFDHAKDQVSAFDALNEISTTKRWEWYVNNQRQFFAHPTTQHTFSTGFSTNILNAQYEEDGRAIINSQRILGPDGNKIGYDNDDYTESLYGWTSSADRTSLCDSTGKGTIIIPFYGPLVAEGVGPSRNDSTASLHFAWDNAADGTIWVRRTFDDPLDLSFYGVLKFDIQWGIGTDTIFGSAEGEFAFKVRFEQDSTNYFEYQYKVSEVSITKTQFPEYGYIVDTGWKAVGMPFNIKLSKSDYTRIGDPSWNDINSIYVEILSPRPTETGYLNQYGLLFIDNMWFDNGHFYAFRQDSASILAYGERRGHLIYDESLSSDAECDQIADTIIQYYKNPIKKFTSITLADIPATIPLGYVSTITVAEIIQPSVIRCANYLLEDFKLSVGLELSSVYIPKIDQIIADLKRFVDEDAMDRLPENINPAVVSNLLNSPLGVKDIDMSKSGDNLISNPRFEIDANADGIPDAWYPSGDWNIAFRSEDEVSSGQWSGLVPAQWVASAWVPRTLSSEVFPFDPGSNHYVAVWAKSSHDVTHTGTFSIQIEYYGVGPAYTLLGSTIIADEQYTNIWKEYTTVLDKRDNPAGVFWGKLSLIGESGNSNFFDDCMVSRFSGIDGGQTSYIRPVEYSTSSESDVLVFSKTFIPGVMPFKYVATGMQADLKVDTADGGNHADFRIITKYNGVEVNTIMVSAAETDWYTMRFNNDIDVGDYGHTLVVDFYLSCGNAAHTAYLRNAEVMLSAYSIKVPVRSRFNQYQKE